MASHGNDYNQRWKINYQIETSNFCNFECGICPNRIMQRKRQFMSDEVWDAILNLYVIPYRHINAKTPPTLICHKDSETLLDRKLPNKLRTVPADMNVDIYTNGVLLPKWRDRGEDFIDVLASLPNRVRILMSFHPNNYDYSNNDYSAVIHYLKGVLRDRPQNIEFITVSHKSKWVSEEVQDMWQQTWDGLPITVHSNCSINPWTGLMEDVATCAYNGCPYADFSHWFFGVTGNVIACCMDLEEEIVLGNVLHDDPAEMFAVTDAFYIEQRRILEAKELHPRGVCRNCFGQKRDSASAELVQIGVPA